MREKRAVSVVIPTLDEQATVAAAIQSVCADADVIVVDGGSQDATVRSRSPRVRPSLAKLPRAPYQGAFALIDPDGDAPEVDSAGCADGVCAPGCC